MEKKGLKVLGIVLVFALLVVPGFFLVITSMTAFFDWGDFGIATFMLMFGGSAAFGGIFAIYKIITKGIKYRINKFLKKRGKRYDRIFITSNAYDRFTNPMAEKYKKITEDKIRSYLPEGLRADKQNKSSLHVNCDWDTFFYGANSSVECTINVYDNLNKSPKPKPLFSYNYSIPHKESQFAEDNLLLSVMSFVERKDFIEFIKSIHKKLENDGLKLRIKKSSDSKAQNNMGTYFRDEEHAHDFWAAQYTLNGPPVIICSFDTVDKAREAIITISFIDEKDGKLMSTETVDYGCYETGQQKGEVIICGHEFSKVMYDEVKLKLKNAGGTIKQATPPKEQSRKPEVKAEKNDEDDKVTYVKTSKRELAPGVTAIYENYRAENEAAAKEFLAYKLIMQPLYYIVVDTPNGTWGKDIDGMYKE